MGKLETLCCSVKPFFGATTSQAANPLAWSCRRERPNNGLLSLGREKNIKVIKKKILIIRDDQNLRKSVNMKNV